MAIKYLDKLTDDELKELLNYVDYDENKIINSVIITKATGNKFYFQDGNYYMFCMASFVHGRATFNRGSFEISDFTISHWSGFDMMINEQNNFNERFREYMAFKFGNTYLDDLMKYHISVAQKEQQKLLKKVMGKNKVLVIK